MRVVGVVASPRRGGNTEIMVREALESASRAGADTELVLVADHRISPCDGCGVCTRGEGCPIEDDMQEICEKLRGSHGIVFGTPVYFFNVSSQAKALIDRTLPFMEGAKLKGKVAAAIVVARRVGAGQVLSLLYSWFTAQRMIIAGGALGYGGDIGEVRDGPGGSASLSAMEEARAVGRNVVRMVEWLFG